MAASVDGLVLPLAGLFNSNRQQPLFKLAIAVHVVQRLLAIAVHAGETGSSWLC
jgi:hypothetical protein